MEQNKTVSVSKKELESIFQRNFLDYEVDFFNYIMESYYNNKKLAVYFARGQYQSILDFAFIYIGMKDMEEQIIQGEKNDGFYSKNRKKE